MNIHKLNKFTIAEVTVSERVINTVDDALDLLGNLYYQGFDGIIINEYNLTPDFFELKSGLAGEILQKFSNYRIKLLVIGDFTKYKSKSLSDFIFESNQGMQVGFHDSIENALRSQLFS